MKNTILFVLSLVLAVPYLAMAAEPKPLVLFDFEKADDLKCFQLDGPTKDNIKAELSPENFSTGKTCLKVSYTDDQWADIQFTKFKGDWSAYNALKVDIFNPTAGLVALSFQGADADAGFSKEAYFGDPEKRVAVSGMLRPGKNTLVFPLKFDRPFDLKKVQMWSLSSLSRPKGLMLYIDNIRLEKVKPEELE
ncbi:MAG: hypothetical protein WCI43_04630 [Candidatus Firestonebacteria bacterium]